MNRKLRRLAKANADAVAANMAAQAYDYTPEGKVVRVTDPVAVAALKRAFAIMIAQGCQPLTTRISDKTAAAFPRGEINPISDIAGAASYLAVGFDPDGCGTYSLRRMVTPGASPQIADAIHRQATLDHLKPHLKMRGFPMSAPESGVQ